MNLWDAVGITRRVCLEHCKAWRGFCLQGNMLRTRGGRPKFRNFVEMEGLLLIVPLLLSDGDFTYGNTTIDL